MSLSDDDLVSLSGSDRQPFHSTPVKQKPAFHSKAKSSLYDEETFEPLTESGRSSTTTPSQVSDSDNGQNTELETTVHNVALFEPSVSINGNLSSWDKWFLRKEKERRYHIISEMRLNKQKEFETRRLEEAKKVQQHLSDITCKLWLKNKNKEIKEQKKIKEQQELLEETRMEQIRNKKQTMSKEKVKQWKEKKEQEEQEMKRHEELKVRISMDEEMERHERNKKAFKAWLKDASKRPKCKHFSYGYIGGLLVGYYDGTSPPKPSYCNPIPWKCPKECSDSILDNKYQPLLF